MKVQRHGKLKPPEGLPAPLSPVLVEFEGNATDATNQDEAASDPPSPSESEDLFADYSPSPVRMPVEQVGAGTLGRGGDAPEAAMELESATLKPEAEGERAGKAPRLARVTECKVTGRTRTLRMLSFLSFVRKFWITCRTMICNWWRNRKSGVGTMMRMTWLGLVNPGLMLFRKPCVSVEPCLWEVAAFGSRSRVEISRVYGALLHLAAGAVSMEV